MSDNMPCHPIKQTSEKIFTDILVIGAGLAGIKAALAAKSTNPALHVTMVSASSAPHGSSFLNLNNQLGIQVCHTDSEKELFLKEAEEIAPPGEINPKLTSILADESESAFKKLRNWGAAILRDKNGDFLKVKGCFSPVQARAYIILNVMDLFFKLINRAEKNGIEFIPNLTADGLRIQTRKGFPSVCGADFKGNEKSDRRVKAEAKAVILACGGMTARHKYCISGVGKAPLKIHNWCEQNGIQYVNKDYTQFVWCRAVDYSHWDINVLNLPGTSYKDCNGRTKEIPARLRHLFEKRRTHVPVSHGLEDSAIDSILINNLNSDGWIEVFHPKNGWEKIILAAQVSNGGIRIDENAWTGLPGLFACGECAGGMHGANRIGGAMVLSGQVFGQRAGKTAAIYASDRQRMI